MTPTTAAMADLIPTCITRCCRDWVSPAFTPGGRCGLCGQPATFVRLLPESEWVRVSPPIREVS